MNLIVSDSFYINSERLKEIESKTILLTCSNNLYYYKKIVASSELNHLVQVMDFNSFLRKFKVNKISSMKLKMYFLKALNKLETDYKVEILDDLIKIYNNEQDYMLDNINSNKTYDIYKSVIEILKEEVELFSTPLEVDMGDYNLVITDPYYNEVEFNFINEIGDSFNNVDVYFCNKSPYKEIIIEKFFGNLIEIKNENESIKTLYAATDLYDEVVYVSNMIAKNYEGDLSKFTIAANNIDEYINYIDLVFKENGINYNYKKEINSLFFEYLISLINKEKTYNYPFKRARLNYSNKLSFFKSVYELANEVDDNTREFLGDVIDNFNAIIGDFDVKLFCQVLEYFKNKTVFEKYNNHVNVVSLSDVTKSDYLFLMGFNMGELSPPKYSNSIIKYADLTNIYSNYPFFYDSMNNRHKIVKAINSSENLFVTYHKINNNDNNTEEDDIINEIEFDFKTNNDEEINYSYLKNTFLNKVGFNNYPKDLYNSKVNEKINDITRFNHPRPININYDKMSLSNTKIDTFNKCHFSYYCKYLLKLEERSYLFDNRIIGSYVHYLFENLIDNDELDIDTLEAEYLKKTTSPKEVFLIKETTKNALTLLPDIKRELRHNDYEVAYKELDISEDSITFNIDNTPVTLKGIIDRVDVSDKYFRIVDYKTGSKEFSLKDILIGVNLQLLIYMIYMERKYNKKVSSVFYQRALITFTKNANYKLSGIIRNNEDAINSLGAEDIFDYVDISMRGNIDLKKAFSDEKFDTILKFTEKKLEDTVVNMKKGLIDINPIMNINTCDYCPYSQICGIEKDSNNYRYLEKRDAYELIKEEVDELD